MDYHYNDYRTRVPAYTDISKFRRPYSNAYMAGFGTFPGSKGIFSKVYPGSERYTPPERYGTSGFGQTPIMLGDVVEKNDKGYWVIKNAYKDMVNDILAAHNVQPLVVEGAQSAALLTPGGSGGLAWVKDQNGVVFIGLTTLAIMVNMHEHFGSVGLGYPPGNDYVWNLVGGSDEAKATAKEAVVLYGDPDSRWGIWGTVAIVGAAAVGGFFIVRGIKK